MMGWGLVLTLVAPNDESLNHKASIAALRKFASISEELEKYCCQPDNSHPEGNKKN